MWENRNKGVSNMWIMHIINEYKKDVQSRVCVCMYVLHVVMHVHVD